MTESHVRAPGAEGADAEPFDPGYGKGGVPFLLLILYLSFLVFFTWYVLEYQLPDYLEQGPGRAAAAEQGG
jgi:hypothetical protein